MNSPRARQEGVLKDRLCEQHLRNSVKKMDSEISESRKRTRECGLLEAKKEDSKRV